MGLISAGGNGLWPSISYLARRSVWYNTLNLALSCNKKRPPFKMTGGVVSWCIKTGQRKGLPVFLDFYLGEFWSIMIQGYCLLYKKPITHGIVSLRAK